MASNSLILLNQLLEQKRKEIAPELSSPDYFEIFSAEQVLKDYDLSYEEIEDGIVDGGGDGGIDSIFLFLNDNLVSDEVEDSNIKRNPSVTLVVVQSKTESGFKEGPIDSLGATFHDIFDLKKSYKSLKSVYNEKLLEKVLTVSMI